MGALFGGIIAAALLSGSVAKIITPFVSPGIWSQIVAFLLVFVAVYIGIKFIHRSIERGLESINLVNLDRALGFCFGIIEGLAIMVIAILLIQIVPLVNEDRIFEHSILVRIVRPFVPTLLDILKR